MSALRVNSGTAKQKDRPKAVSAQRFFRSSFALQGGLKWFLAGKNDRSWHRTNSRWPDLYLWQHDLPFVHKTGACLL
jgi:hypothetical protein